MRQRSNIDTILLDIVTQAVVIAVAYGVPFFVDVPCATMIVVLESGVYVGTIGHKTRRVPPAPALVCAGFVTHIHAYVLVCMHVFININGHWM